MTVTDLEAATAARDLCLAEMRAARESAVRAERAYQEAHCRFERIDRLLRAACRHDRAGAMMSAGRLTYCADCGEIVG